MHWFRSKQEWYKTHPSKTRTFILWIPLQSDKVPFFLSYFFFFTYSPFSSTTLFFVSMPLATKHPQCNPINLKCYVSSSLPTELFCLLEPVNIYDVQFVCICHFTRCCVRVFETIPYYVFLKGREIQSQTVFIVNGIKCTTSSQKQDLTHCCLASRSRLTRNIKGRGVWKEDDVKPVPPFLCHALLPFNHASVYVFQSVLLLFTEPKHDTQAIHCDPSSLSVKLVRVAWTVTLTIHHVYPATLH